MRSLPEIAFRLRQEITNVALLATQPQYHGPVPSQVCLPDPTAVIHALKGSAFADQVNQIADQVLLGRFPAFGSYLDTGGSLDWRRDYRHGRTSGTVYFRKLKYLDFHSVGDHKYVWEINRHQHWVVLAQAFLFTRRDAYLVELDSQIASWQAQNPFQRGINWVSALEVGFRAISWIWVYHLLAPELSVTTRKALVNGLFQHGLHLATNLSIYFSPNTHLLGEAVALYAIGKLFPTLPHAHQWLERASEIVLAQLDFQVKADGSHFEQSSYYHVYALDFFLWFYLLAGKPQQMQPKLKSMADYLHQHLGSFRKIQFFGDDDGGRLFHPFGDRRSFGRATLATCSLTFHEPGGHHSNQDIAEQAAWWLGVEPEQHPLPEVKPALPSANFPDSGMVFLRRGAWQLQFDAGPFGYGGAGHSHADTLSFCLQRDTEDVLLDPGTYTYIRDPEIRNQYRGTSAHNTVVVNKLNQATPSGPFRWTDKPSACLHSWGESPGYAWVDASCQYRNVAHRRRLILNQSGVLVMDDITTDAESVQCEQYWHFGPSPDNFPLRSSGVIQWRFFPFSNAYGQESEGRCAVISFTGAGSAQIVTAIGDYAGTLSIPDFLALFDEVVTKKPE